MFIRLSFFFLVSFSLGAAVDREIALDLKYKEGNIGSFQDSFKDLNQIQADFETQKKMNSRISYGLRQTSEFAKIATSGVPAIASFVGAASFGFNLILDGADYLINKDMGEIFGKKIRGAIYLSWKKDKKRIDNAFSIKNNISRTKEVYKILNELDSFGHFIEKEKLSTDQRAIVNSRMILKLSDVVQNLNKSTFKSAAEIEKLKNDNEQFNKFVKENPKFFGEYADYLREKEKFILKGQRVSKDIGRSISSIDEEKKKGKSVATIKEEEKDLRTTSNKIADFTDEAQVYLSKASIVANNLLKGKDLERANKALFYLGNSMKVLGGAAKLSGGDPMGAMDMAVGLSTLFGRKNNQPNAATLRHQAIMDAFGEVFKNQKLILENQEKIYMLQVQNYKLLARLYKTSKQEFKMLNERIDVMLGNQMSILGNTVEFSNIKENLNQCKEFLDSRFYCRSAYLEENGNLNTCLLQISKQKPLRDYKDHFVPYSLQKSPVLVMGKFDSLEELLTHFKSGENKEMYNDCKEGIKILLGQQTMHPLFLSRTYPKEGSFTSYNDDFIIPVYKPLIDLANKYFLGTTKRANAFYRSLINPHEEVKYLSMKAQNLFRFHVGADEYDMLGNGQIRNSLTSLIYTSALDHYVSYFSELSSYWDITEKKSGENEIMPKSMIMGLMDTGPSHQLKKYFKKLVKLVNIAIAQQNLIAGDIMIPLISNILYQGKGGVDFETAKKALAKNPYLSKNILIYILAQSFDSKINSKELYSSFKTYEDKGLLDCKWNKISRDYGKNCRIKFLTSTNLPFVFKEKGIYLKNTKIRLPASLSSGEIRARKMFYNPFFYRTTAIRDMLYSKITKFKGVPEYALFDNLYTW